MTMCRTIPNDVAVRSLKSIRCGGCYVSDEVLIAISQRCAELETLQIFEVAEYRRVYPVTDQGVRAELEGCPLLRETDLEYAQSITAELRTELVRLGYFSRLRESIFR
jgi:hypothetical protein